MFKIKSGKDGPVISLTRGDYASFTIEMKDASGEPYVLQEGDEVYFTVKRSTKDEEYLIQKTGTEIEILPADTEEFAYGTYKYDVQLSPADGKIDTFIGPSDFIITEEVTWGGDPGGK